MRKIMARLSVFRCPLLTIPYKTYSDTSYFTHKLLNFEKELHYQNLIKIQAKTPPFYSRHPRVSFSTSLNKIYRN